MSDTNCATCGATFPPPPEGGGAAGYASDYEGNRYCYDCAFKREKERMIETGKGFVYVKPAPDNEVGRGYCYRIIVTNWVGKEFGKGIAFPIHESPTFGGSSERRNIRFWFNGEVWAGTWFVSSGDYARVRRTKLKSL